MACQTCHLGMEDNTFETREEAHTGMVADPSAFNAEGEITACQECHQEEVDATRHSLHTNLWGEKAAIEVRGRCTFEGAGIDDMFSAKCGGCHTTCGQCHVSRPASVGGGFPKIGTYYSHKFRATPDMNEQCTACHGSRVGTDYKGELEGNLPDLHRSRGMKCEDCHTKDEIHGDPSHTVDNHYEHRYEVADMPRCENGACHPSLASNEYHDAHVGGEMPNLQCQVCHSQPYKNCTNCHNLVADPVGEKFDIDPSVVQFKIGRNTNPNRSQYEFVVVRHVPVDPGTYDDWGLPLPGYLDAPTWKYASPHNILKNTPQTTVAKGKACSTACHDSPEGPEGFLLRESDLYEADGVTKLPDYNANLNVIIPDSFPGKK
jgi:hypothetical protein